jgi:hypothetical protein
MRRQTRMGKILLTAVVLLIRVILFICASNWLTEPMKRLLLVASKGGGKGQKLR